MNPAQISALTRTIEFLRHVACADVAAWPELAKSVDGLPRVGLDTGITASAVAALGRSFVRQLPEIPVAGADHARAVVENIAHLLHLAFNEQHRPPYYNRDIA